MLFFPFNTQWLRKAERYVEGCPASSDGEFTGAAQLDELFICTCRAHVSGSWADQWLRRTQSTMMGFAAKISISNCQVVERWEERLVYLLHTAARKKTNSKVNWLRIILLLSILYSFYHGKITCNIRLYLQFHFYKMSLQGFSFFSLRRVKNSRLEHAQIKTYTFTHIQTKIV